LKFLQCGLLAFCLFGASAHADTRLNVVGLFSNKAIVTINGGAPKTISAGQSVGDVKLISADSNSATFVIAGKRQVLKIGQAIDALATAGADANTPVVLKADATGHYFGTMVINETSLKYVVDTGASAVTLNSIDAKKANINYAEGDVIGVSTASGLSTAHRVMVRNIRIGTLVLDDVQVLVTDNDAPPVVLLGMTALNRLGIKTEDSTLTLTRKY
jgi:aspartyl protease family protein